MGKWWWHARQQARTDVMMAAAVILCIVSGARIGFARVQAPEWMRTAAAESTPPYPAKTKAVILYYDRELVVHADGTMLLMVRKAIKFLRPRDEEDWPLVVDLDKATQLKDLKAWGIDAHGQAFEVKERDAVETELFPDYTLYTDDHQKILQIPGAEQGGVIGYEYQMEIHPYTLTDIWDFGSYLPVVKSQYALQLPKNWSYKAVWIRHPQVAPQSVSQNAWLWKVKNVSAVDTEEPLMPPADALEGEMGLIFYAPPGVSTIVSPTTWNALGAWESALAQPQRIATPAIQQKVAQLTAALPTTLAKIQAIASFVQQNVRYVAIEYGIGGVKPHAAGEIFTNLYGDCKDKATLLSAMLSVIGVKSYYVVINADHGEVHSSFPSPDGFDHMILAIVLPKDVPTLTLYSTQSDPQLGTLIFFDPTDRVVPFGFLPSSEQGNHALLVRNGGGELIQIPVLPPSLNHVLRYSSITLAPTGDADADVEEVMDGAPVFNLVGALISLHSSDRPRFIRNVFGRPFGQFQLDQFSPSSIPVGTSNVVLRYHVAVHDYARTTGNLMLLQPRLPALPGLDRKLMIEKNRKYAVQFSRLYFDTDMITYTLPAGYQAQGVPPPMDLKTPFGNYKRTFKDSGNQVVYVRSYKLDAMRVPESQVGSLVKFLDAVDQDTRTTLLLESSGAAH